MKAFDIIVLTEDRYINPTEITPYVQNILTEDNLILNALKKHGLQVERKSWADNSFDWSQTQYAFFRTTWDYFDRFDAFIRWMSRASKQTKLINSFKLAQWNLDKHYLQDLEKAGVPIVPSHFIKPLAKTTLASEITLSGFKGEIILKPAISGTARHTYRIKPSNIENHEKIFHRLIREESLIIQPFMNTILHKGEISLIFFGGNYSHAILKKAKLGDFRVQDDFGGTVQAYEPNESEIALAKKALNACPSFPLYARVDIIWDNEGNEVISELELIEPELFFRMKTGAAEALAQVIVHHMES